MRIALSAVALSLCLAAPLHAQTGLLVVAHGAGPEWNAKVRETVAQVEWRQGPISVAFLMGPEATTAGWDAAVDSLARAGATEIVAVPLMVSTYGGHVRQIEYLAGLRPDLPAELAQHASHSSHTRAPIPVRVTGALDAAPELGVALAERWRALEARDRKRPVVLVAHGPSDDREAEAWIRNLNSSASVLPLAGLTRPFAIALLRDDAPPEVRAAAVADMREKIEKLSQSAKDSVVVLPVLISSGPILDTKIPADLQGLPVRYSRTPLAPLPALARWIERVAASSSARLSLAE